MAEINQITISGHLVADPALRTLETQHGNVAVCKARMAQSRYRKTSDGNFEKAETSFFDIEAWRETALLLESNFQKGSHIVVFGRLRMESWKDRATGTNRQKFLVSVDSVWDGVRVSEAPDKAREYIRDDYKQQQEYEQSQEPEHYEDEYSQERPPRRPAQNSGPSQKRIFDNQQGARYYGRER